MTPRYLQAISASLLILLCTWGGSTLAAQDAWADQADKQARLEKLKKDINQLRVRINQTQSRHTAEQKALRVIDEKIQERIREIRQLDKSIAKLRSQLTSLAEEEKESLRIMREQQTLLGHQIRASYAMGREQGLKLLLNARNPEHLQRMMNYYQHLNTARSEEIQDYRETALHLETVRRSILEKNQHLQQNSTTLNKSRQTLELEKIEREKTVASINRQLQRSQKQLGQMEENQKQLEQVLKEVERAVANLQLDKDATPFKTLRNQMPWPAEGPLVRKYGSRSPDGIGSTGIVIQSAVNTPVRAIHHGRVVFSDWLRGFGLLMIVDHGDGFMSLYGFNQALLKDTGDWVNEGDVLASVGNSGGQREGGLYFEIRYKGKPDNPLLWLKKNS